MLGVARLSIVAAFFLAALPAWPYSQAWGYGPGGVLSIVLVAPIALLAARGI